MRFRELSEVCALYPAGDPRGDERAIWVEDHSSHNRARQGELHGDALPPASECNLCRSFGGIWLHELDWRKSRHHLLVGQEVGDVYIHETVVSHVRRLLDNEFTCSRLDETPAQFAARMEAVQAFMNSPDFAREGGGRGLAGLARELRSRCELVISRKGERIPK